MPDRSALCRIYPTVYDRGLRSPIRVSPVVIVTPATPTASESELLNSNLIHQPYVRTVATPLTLAMRIEDFIAGVVW